MSTASRSCPAPNKAGFFMTEPPLRDSNAPAHWLGVGRLRALWIADRSCYPQRSRSLVSVAVPAIGIVKPEHREQQGTGSATQAPYHHAPPQASRTPLNAVDVEAGDS